MPSQLRVQLARPPAVGVTVDIERIAPVDAHTM